MIEWNIQSRAQACRACARVFADQQVYHTLLFDERQGYERMDVCEPCWAAQYGHGAVERKGFVSHWQGVYETPPPRPPEAIQKETAETLLRKLVEQNEPQFAAARFILAVMLERKRLLKVKAQLHEAGRRVFLYEHARSGDLFHIVDPDLQLTQLEAVQHDVSELLERGLQPPPDATFVAPANGIPVVGAGLPAPAEPAPPGVVLAAPAEAT